MPFLLVESGRSAQARPLSPDGTAIVHLFDIDPKE